MFVQHNVQILGISFDTVETNKVFADRNRFLFPLLCDSDGKVGEVYGAGSSGFSRRMSYLIDEEGLIIHVFPRVNPETHAAEVLALLG